MADPSTYRPKAGEIPTTPGVYRFRDADERVIYVGKARDLRQRLNSYFANLANLHPRTQQMVTTAARVEWTVVANEVEALQLEYAWIKEYDPRFNVKYRDDKSYPYLAVTMGEEFPRVQVLRGSKRKGTRYFGPYAHAWAIRETVDLLLRVFPVRTCSAGVFKRANQVGRPCLLGYIDKCSAPCVGRISPEDHKDLAADFCDFVAGRTEKFVKRVEREMRAASDDLDFERAARLRDDLGALTRAMEKSAIVLQDGTDADVFALADDELEAAVQVFHVRDGRVRGQRGWVVEKVEELTTGDLVEHLLQQVYGDAAAEAVPREVLVPELPTDVADVERWLVHLRGKRVEVKIPQRGDKRALMETVANNARHSLALHKTRRAGDLTTRSQALQELQEALDLPDAPLRIECYDISNIQGEHVVGSMVVFEDGLPRKSEYRKFTVRGDEGFDDVASIREVITRRFRVRETEEENRRFAYKPNLLVVDGGPPQVAAAARAMAEAGVTGVALCGLAKRLEEVWLPNDPMPLVLPRTSEGLYLLQRVRDEAHRFAITHHRQRRGKAMTVSELDAVPGLGPARKKALLTAFGSVKKLRAASAEQIASIQGVGPKVAVAVVEALAAPAAPAGKPGQDAPLGVTVDMATGEIIDA